ncbi:MAG: O-antigen ligase family protein [Acidobacteria bacterium]|nr:O-antigen ligase family protein [Acidobacteriota bacterium]
MSRLTRILVLTSAALAVATAAYADAPAIRSLPLICAGAAVLGALISRISRRAALFLSLLPVYLSPAMFLVLQGHDHYTYVTVWMAALLGTIAATGGLAAWSVPARWRWAIATWAVIVATSWPLVAWRELDFTWPFVWDNRLPVAGIAVAGPRAVAWTAYVALSHLIGLLWVDWLFLSYGAERRESFPREVLAPLGIAVAIACAVGAYQGFVDIAFLSGHIWPSINRAAGTLMDGNAFGMVAALWAPTFLAVGLIRSRFAWAIGGAGLALAWAGVWTSGARAALLAAVIGTVLVTLQLPRHLSSRRERWRYGIAIAVACALFVAAILTVPSISVTAVDRTRELLPSPSMTSVRNTARYLWERDGYGPVAITMFANHPLAGVGVGAYHTFCTDYARLAAGIQIAPDNAQNWFRHQLAELGLLGSVGWIVWVAVFAFGLWPRRSRLAGPGAVLNGPLVGFAAASMLGMPGQDPAVVITFWLLVFWYAADTGTQPATASMRHPAWIAVLAISIAYVAALATASDLRPPFRAARFDFNYTYGFDFQKDVAWTGRRAVTVPPATDRWLKLTVWVEHPDANRDLVRADVRVNGKRVVGRRLSRDIPVTSYVRVPEGAKRIVIEARTDRAFRPERVDSSTQDSGERGLAMKWEFVPNAPGQPR